MAGLGEKIQKALSAGTLCVWYQPIFNRETGRFDAAEALMRLYCGGEMLPTLASICEMEKSGEIAMAGRLVFEQVCSFMSRHQELTPPHVHVNLSCRQMQDIKNADAMINTASRYGIDPARINLEITETAADCGKEGVLFVHRLLAQGFTFSLDDFGMQHSNCNRLLQYPVRIVKTDKFFFDMAMQNKRAERILDGMFNIAKGAGCELVVEGVGDASQINREVFLGIRHFQGNGFAEAMPEEKYARFLSRHANLPSARRQHRRRR